MKGDREPYRVILPFRSATNSRLVPPVELPDATISGDGSDYLAEMIVTATSGTDALAQARLILADTLGAFAVQRAGFVEVHDARRRVQLVNPQPVVGGPVPPFDVVGGGVTAVGAEWIDPTGESRRSRKILNIGPLSLTLTRNNLDQERRWLTFRDAWPSEVRRAVALIHAGEVAGDAGVAFVLAFAALEVVALPAVGLLPLKIPDSPDRARIVESVRGLLAEHPNLSEDDVARLINSLSAAHAESPIARFAFAFAGGGIEMDAQELKWMRDQRGAYVHPGDFDNSEEALGRRAAFRAAVATLVGSRLDQVALK